VPLGRKENAKNRGKSLPQLGRENFFQGEVESARDELRFVAGEDEWWSEKNVIAARAVHAALCWISKNIFLQCSLTNLFGDIFFFRKRLAREFVFYEFDAQEQAEAANFADIRM
jgi:hypothetical protein